MSNAPFWSLTPEALASQAAAPIPAQHGPECICRHCASGSYADLLSKSDYQRHEIARLTQELAKARMAASIEKYRRLSLVIDQAIAAGNREAWAKATAERMDLGIAVQQAADMTEGK